MLFSENQIQELENDVEISAKDTIDMNATERYENALIQQSED